jgi:hypothetical protein
MSRREEILAESKSILERFGALVGQALSKNDTESRIVAEAKALTKRHTELMDELRKLEKEWVA